MRRRHPSASNSWGEQPPPGAVPTPNGSPNPSRGRASSLPSLSLSFLLRGDEEALEKGDAERQGSEPAPPARRHYGPAAITRPPPPAHAPGLGLRGAMEVGGEWRCLEGRRGVGSAALGSTLHHIKIKFCAWKRCLNAPWGPAGSVLWARPCHSGQPP